MVSSMYSNTKDLSPYIKTVCEAAEQGVRTITSVALTTASPIMGKLEPQSKNLSSIRVCGNFLNPSLNSSYDV